MIIGVPRNTGILFIYYGDPNWFGPAEVPEALPKGAPEVSSEVEGYTPGVVPQELSFAEVTSQVSGEPLVPEAVSIEIAKPQGPGV